MMGALPQTATPGVNALLAVLPPAQAGEAGPDGLFDQLVAQRAPGAAAVTAPVGVAMPVAASPAPPSATETPAVQPTIAPAAPGKPVRPIAVEPELADTGKTEAEMPAPTAGAEVSKAVVAANELLATLAHFTKPATAKPGATAPKAEDESGEEGEAAAETAPVAAMALVQPAIEPRPAAKPAAEAAPRRDEQPALPMAAPRVRDAAASLPAATLASAEAPLAKPAGEASMTILFAQPATQAAAIAEVAKPVAIAERVLDLISDDAWIEQLASDIAATKSATNEVSFRLMPRHLGRLDVSMLAGDEGVSLKLDTQHEATATIVTAVQVRLVDDLRQQGVRVADSQVTHTPDQAGRQSQQGQGRSPAQEAAHLIETATARTELRETDDQERAGDRRGRFA